MDTADLIKKVRKIEIKTKGLSNQIFSGSYHSTFKGQGMSFSEVREYAYGDDVRNIDWNVTARTGSPFVKIYEEERELTVILLIDVSSSMDYGVNKALKKEIAAELAAIISFSAINNNDKVGAIFFSDKIESYLPPKKGKKNILRIIREIINIDAKGRGSNVKEALKYFNGAQKKRTIAFLISDFITSDYELTLNLVTRKHDLIGINLFDQSEREFPNLGLVRMQDAETGQTLVVDTSSSEFRSQYLHINEQRKLQFENIFKKSGTDFINIDVGKDYIKELINFFKKRA